MSRRSHRGAAKQTPWRLPDPRAREEGPAIEWNPIPTSPQLHYLESQISPPTESSLQDPVQLPRVSLLQPRYHTLYSQEQYDFARPTYGGGPEVPRDDIYSLEDNLSPPEVPRGFDQPYPRVQNASRLNNPFLGSATISSAGEEPSPTYQQSSFNLTSSIPPYSRDRGYDNPNANLQFRNSFAETSQGTTQGTSVENVTTSFNSLPVEDDLEHASIARPDRFFRLGRIFKTAEKDQAFVVIREEQGFSTVCTLENNQDSTNAGFKLEQFPIFIENPSISIESPISLNFNKLERIGHDVKVQKIGRIDRNSLRRLRATYNSFTNESKNLEAKDDLDVENTSDVHKRVDSYLSGRPITVQNDEADFGPISALDLAFRVHSSRDFQFGRVFKIYWVEPMGQPGPTSSYVTDQIEVKLNYDEMVYATIRRFVIVRAVDGHCMCLPILTYGRQATTKRGVKPQDHAIIYTAKGNQKYLTPDYPSEAPGEEKLSKTPIRIVPKTPRDKLDPSSRLNYAKIYTVEYNVKVCFVGRIHENSIKYFQRDYNLTHKPLPQGLDVEYSDDTEDKP